MTKFLGSVLLISSWFVSLTTDRSWIEETQEPHKCPTISVSCLEDDCGCGPEFELLAQVRGGDPNIKPTYKWTIANGQIVRGQGIAQISVKGETQDKTMTATVEVSGYDASCAKTASISVVCCRLPPPSKYLVR